MFDATAGSRRQPDRQRWVYGVVWMHRTVLFSGFFGNRSKPIYRSACITASYYYTVLEYSFRRSGSIPRSASLEADRALVVCLLCEPPARWIPSVRAVSDVRAYGKRQKSTNKANDTKRKKRTVSKEGRHHQSSSSSGRPKKPKANLGECYR